MQIKHELKTDPLVFHESFIGNKPFEIRKNDRNFKVGDAVLLRETKFSGFAMAYGKPLEYTGRAIEVNIDYILFGPCYGVLDGWVIMSVSHKGE